MHALAIKINPATEISLALMIPGRKRAVKNSLNKIAKASSDGRFFCFYGCTNGTARKNICVPLIGELKLNECEFVSG